MASLSRYSQSATIGQVWLGKDAETRALYWSGECLTRPYELESSRKLRTRDPISGYKASDICKMESPFVPIADFSCSELLAPLSSLFFK